MRQTLESGQWDRVGGWWDKKGQNEIDLAAIDRGNRKILIGEVKTNPKKFDEAKLGEKARAFLQETGLTDCTVELRGLSLDDMFG